MSRQVADLSVLMPVHDGVDPRHLDAALYSIEEQRRPAAEIVVVVDGPVSAAHEQVLALRDHLIVVRLPQNVGSGLARREGLRRCSCTWVALADSDDLSLPNRFEHQLRVLAETGADVCTSAMLEFESAGSRDLGVRRVPATHAEFARLLPVRNPVNQPATMLRRSAAMAAGSYQHLPYLEDYDLWARMLRAGAVFAGNDVPVVRFRLDGMLARRTTRSARRSEREFQRRLRDYGLVGGVGHARNRLLRGTYLLLPPRLLACAYRVLFRRSPLEADLAQAELAETQRSSVA